MKSNRYFICAVVMAGMACAASAGSEEQLNALYRINGETEAKMQAQVLDRMLGPGKAFAFLEMSAEVKTTADEQSKDGVGELRTKLPEGSVENGADFMGKEGRKKAGKDKKAASMQEQSARQVKKTAEKKGVFNFTMASMKARILHDAALSPEKLAAVKEALLALYPEKIKPEDIVFVPAAFEPVP